MGTELDAVKKTMYQEDVAFKRGVSESILTKVGQQSQFINKFQTDIKEFKLNGQYSVATGISFFDGIASFFYNSEIVGVSFYNGRKGVSGNTIFDIRWKNQAGVDQGSIFNVKPSISSVAPDESIGFKNLITNYSNPAIGGVVLPTFSKTEFLQGESLYLILSDSMVSPFNCGLTLFYRPIN